MDDALNQIFNISVLIELEVQIVGDRVLGPEYPEEKLRDSVAGTDHSVGNIEKFLAGNEVDRDVVVAASLYTVLHMLVHDQEISLSKDNFGASDCVRYASLADIHHLYIVVGVGFKIHESCVGSHCQEPFLLEKAVTFNFVGTPGKIDVVACERHFIVEIELFFRCYFLKFFHDCCVHVMSFLKQTSQNSALSAVPHLSGEALCLCRRQANLHPARLSGRSHLLDRCIKKSHFSGHIIH